MATVIGTLGDGSIVSSTSWVSVYTCPASKVAIGLLLEASNQDPDTDTYLNIRVTRSGGSARVVRRGLLEQGGGYCTVELTRLSDGDEVEIQTEVSCDHVDWVVSGKEQDA